jgi:flagellar biosynthesis component FlhA
MGIGALVNSCAAAAVVVAAAAEAAAAQVTTEVTAVRTGTGGVAAGCYLLSTLLCVPGWHQSVMMMHVSVTVLNMQCGVQIHNKCLVTPLTQSSTQGSSRQTDRHAGRGVKAAGRTCG